ncbi:MAG: glycerol kinase GlpK [Alphaproteobacteria bacterium]|nr:glycerol kinase GlpK [Alphaproteobacteria bacterium]
MRGGHIVAIDQGTTSTRAMVFDRSRRPVARARHELRQIYPRQGWVEHDPEEIWDATVETVKAAMAEAGLGAAGVAAIGIANQRETTVLWDRRSGRALHNAIVWQDRRTAPQCDGLRAQGKEALVRERTGLLLDPYFSATKIAWLLDAVPGARAAAEQGDLAAGTIDSFLLWRLTGGAVHATDATNASRTMLFDIHRQAWDDSLLDLFAVPGALLPIVMDCAADFGTTDPSLFGGAIRIAGIAGDQHAATVGQACFEPGAVKSTYGTGCFAVVNTGSTPIASQNRLLTTLAYRLDGQPTYAIEGSIFIAGAAVQWLRDGLGIIGQAAESEALAKGAKADSAVYLVPAFTGLGAPYWDAGARGALHGLTRDSGAAEIARAALEAVAYQTRDLFEAMAADGTAPPRTIRVDGGMTENNWFLQFLADTLAIAVERPAVTDTTALGAAYLAGLRSGLYPSPAEMKQEWRAEARFEPRMPEPERERRYEGWLGAVARTRS